MSSLTLVNVWASVGLAYKSIILTDQNQIIKKLDSIKTWTVVNEAMTSKMPKKILDKGSYYVSQSTCGRVGWGAGQVSEAPG